MELRILICFAAFLLLLPIVRPLIRRLWKLSGLTVCPLLALGILTGVFLAYGFRPECVPLLLFAVFLTIANISDFFALLLDLQSDAYRDRSLFFTLASAVVFAFSFWVTIYFAPPMNVELSVNGVNTLFLGDEKLHVRIYNPDSDQGKPERPLLILFPPVAGSFTVSDEVCTALRDRGFTVLACSRLNFDSPSFNQNGTPVRLFIPGLYRLANALTRGLRNTTANAGGRALEEIRKQDTLFLLHELSINKTLQNFLSNTDKNRIFLAGYGAGGAALTALSGEDFFSAAYPQVRGIIAIEAPLLSSLEGDPPPPLPPPAPDPISAFFQQIGVYLERLKPGRITHMAGIPRPNLPILFILSDRVMNERTGRYETIIRSLGSSRNAALLAAVRGAGPFDYSSSPIQYPLYSFLFQGTKRNLEHGSEPWDKNRNWPELTASLITNFAVMVWENEYYSYDDEDLTEIPLTKTALDSNTYLERGGVWKIPSVQTMLNL